MKAYFLARIGGQLFAVEKERVAGIGIRPDGMSIPEDELGRQYLPLPGGNRAVINTLLFSPGTEGTWARSRQGFFLIIGHGTGQVALPMTGKGRLVTADEKGLQPLPPAFPEEARALIPWVLINGSDVICLVNPEALCHAAGPARGSVA